MKWFKHETDAHTNLKHQSVIENFADKGVEAFGYYWACLEIVGHQGENFRLKRAKNWKNQLKKFLGLDIERQEVYLKFFAKKDLIDKKALKIGDLYIPKLEERQDEYTEKLRRKSRHSPDNVPLEQKRIEQKRIEQTRGSLKNDRHGPSPKPGSPPVAIGDALKVTRERLQADGVLKKST